MQKPGFLSTKHEHIRYSTDRNPVSQIARRRYQTEEYKHLNIGCKIRNIKYQQVALPRVYETEIPAILGAAMIAEISLRLISQNLNQNPKFNIAAVDSIRLFKPKKRNFFLELIQQLLKV
jgi:hypothetical protein